MNLEKIEILQNILVKDGIITSEKLADIESSAAANGISFIDYLVRNQIISEEKLYKIIADILNIPYIDIEEFSIDAETLKTVPEKLIKKYKIVPLFTSDNTLTIAISDPANLNAIDHIKSEIKMNIDTCISTPSQINSALEQHYGVSSSVSSIMDTILEKADKEGKIVENLLATSIKDEGLKDQPVIKLVNILIQQAIDTNASDIHIEPQEKTLRIRMRVDGVLHHINTPPKYLELELIARIKVMANMDITENRLPQDGRFTFKDKNNRTIDIRVSSVPSVHGEHIVLRILNTDNLNVGLDKIGFSSETLAKYRLMIKRPHGIVLVTGPTGSGKTTTLYSSITEIASVEKNIITIEDPVEYKLSGIRQIQTNAKIGLTFANGLRSILRQDPDIIFVGEIRDEDTARIAIQSALTGHLVLSTLHTNDSVGALTRLVDMGIEPFLIASSLTGVMAQRLVRKVCDNCKEKLKISNDEALLLGIKKDAEYVTGKGCKKCLNTGYKGRTAIFELLEITNKIKEAIMIKASSAQIKEIAIEQGLITLKEDGLKKAEAGITSIEEILKAVELEQGE